LCSTTRPAIAAPQLRDDIFDRLTGPDHASRVRFPFCSTNAT
jgi:hypothetical protein